MTKMNNKFWDDIGEELYKINRALSLKLAVENDKVEQEKLMHINSSLSDIIRVTRISSKDIFDESNTEYTNIRKKIQEANIEKWNNV
jgi:hypothetical protein